LGGNHPGDAGELGMIYDNYDKQRPFGNQKLDPAELWLVIGEYFESEQNGCRWDWFITIFWGPDAFE